MSVGKTVRTLFVRTGVVAVVPATTLTLGVPDKFLTLAVRVIEAGEIDPDFGIWNSCDVDPQNTYLVPVTIASRPVTWLWSMVRFEMLMPATRVVSVSRYTSRSLTTVAITLEPQNPLVD
jgi:hypothetical protein